MHVHQFSHAKSLDQAQCISNSANLGHARPIGVGYHVFEYQLSQCLPLAKDTRTPCTSYGIPYPVWVVQIYSTSLQSYQCTKCILTYHE